jgi:hypothetical protein
MGKIVAVTEKVEHAGTILMWTLRGATDLQRLTAAWDREGLRIVDLPEGPSPATALRRALSELREKRRLIRPLGRGDGFAVVRELTDGEDLDYRVEMKVKLDKVGRLTIEGGDTALREEVRASFDRHGNELSTEDVSTWLVGLIPSLDGVPMRGGGGVYFVPHHNLPLLDRMVRVLKSATDHNVYRIPAIHEGDDASRSDVVQAILDSIEAEAAAEAEAMEKDLAAAAFGSRGLENRITHTDEVEQKIGRYEALVGTRLDGIRDRLTSLRAGLTVAMSKALAEEEKRRGEAAGPSLAEL